MAIALLLLWLAAIAGQLAVFIVAAVRRIPAPLFLLFFLAQFCCSAYMAAFLQGEDYKAFRFQITPWMMSVFALVAIEAFLLVCWKLPRFRWLGLIIFAVTTAFGTAVALAGSAVLTWPAVTSNAQVAVMERNVGLVLAGMLSLTILFMSKFSAVDRGALHHTAALAILAGAEALGHVVGFMIDKTTGSFLIVLGGVAAQWVWIATVKAIDLTKQQPGPPLDKAAVDRVWGASA